ILGGGRYGGHSVISPNSRLRGLPGEVGGLQNGAMAFGEDADRMSRHRTHDRIPAWCRSQCPSYGLINVRVSTAAFFSKSTPINPWLGRRISQWAATAVACD